jgi:hypothetical protein
LDISIHLGPTIRSSNPTITRRTELNTIRLRTEGARLTVVPSPTKFFRSLRSKAVYSLKLTSKPLALLEVIELVGVLTIGPTNMNMTSSSTPRLILEALRGDLLSTILVIVRITPKNLGLKGLNSKVNGIELCEGLKDKFELRVMLVDIFFDLSHNHINVLDELLLSLCRVDVELSGHTINLNSTTFYWEWVTLGPRKECMSRDKILGELVANEQFRVTSYLISNRTH